MSLAEPNAANEDGAPSEGAGDDVAYGYRPSLMGAQQDFVIRRDGLHWQIGRHSGRIPYDKITRVRLAYRPMTMQMHRYTAEIWSDAAPKLTVASTSTRSLVAQDRNDGPYKAFVYALHRRIAEAGARPAFRRGLLPLAYWPGAAMYLALAMALPMAAVRAPRGESLLGALMVAIIIGVFLVQLGLFFWRNRPGDYDPIAVPEIVLPRG